MALRLLRESPAARDAVQGRYRYILVDEFQDTNRAQAELVALIAERHRNVTVVGDDDQAIYRFRGAAVSNILEFRERYRGSRTVVLRRNYRSRAPILDAAYRLIRCNDPDRLEVRAGVSKRLVAERSDQRVRSRPARGLRERHGGGGLDRGRDLAAGRVRRTAARPRDPGPRERACRPGPSQPQPGRPPLAVLRDIGPVRASGGAPPPRLPARRRRPLVERRRLRGRDLPGVPAGRSRHDSDRHIGAPPEPVALGGARGARRAAGHPASDPGDAGVRHEARRRPAAVQRSGPRAARGRGPVCLPAGIRFAVPARGDGIGPGRRRHSRTSRGSSTSSAASRRSSRTTGPSSWPVISRRSSRRATIRRPRRSTRTRTRSRS